MTPPGAPSRHSSALRNIWTSIVDPTRRWPQCWPKPATAWRFKIRRSHRPVHQTGSTPTPVDLLRTLDAEQRRAVKEGLTEDELALFDLLRKEELSKADREKVKLASRELLAAVRARLSELDQFWETEQTKAEVEVLIMDEVYLRLPEPPFTKAEKERFSRAVYSHVWQQAVDGRLQKAA
jgi:hypothetical protein